LNIIDGHQELTVDWLFLFVYFTHQTVIQRLEAKFPKSARVTVLHGMLMEAQGDLLGAKSFYEQELEKSFSPKNADLGSVGELNMVSFHATHEVLRSSQETSLIYNIRTLKNEKTGFLIVACPETVDCTPPTPFTSDLPPSIPNLVLILVINIVHSIFTSHSDSTAGRSS
jgi:hypothetical protein